MRWREEKFIDISDQFSSSKTHQSTYRSYTKSSEDALRRNQIYGLDRRFIAVSTASYVLIGGWMEIIINILSKPIADPFYLCNLTGFGFPEIVKGVKMRQELFFAVVS